MQIGRTILASAFVVAFPTLTLAHPIKGVGDFYNGVLHPFTSLEFVLPAVASALFAGQQRRVAAIVALGAFPIALAAGAATAAGAHSFSNSLSSAEWLGPLVMSVVGLCVALSLRGPTIGVAALFTIFGFVLGSAQGVEINSGISVPKFTLGTGCTGLIVMTYGIGLVRRLRRPWTHIAVRVAGSWVAAAGFMVLALTRSHAAR